MIEDNNKILDRYVGARLRDRRKALNLTQAELADLVGLSHQQVQRYESGENTISMARVLEFSRSLNVKLEYFYDNAPLTQESPSRGIIQKKTERTLKLILIEDDPNDVLLFRKAVEKSSIAAEVEVVQIPEKAIDFTHQRKPDLIILDVNMPRINGLQLLQKLKADEQLRVVPVVMLTNSIRSKELLEAYANHASGFIQKSSDLHQFYADIHQLLSYWSQAMVLPSAA